ncbi:hypothetical protein M427DRAFT_136757 [Gonapodya prolifera JEL478]|uniref:Uncharacterized protein n=1 Tax=Gonapodya prolifera (strain JEL478) TaxID=1344416 RepID=A0A139A8X9_GONPJ|nr:hypothetical protein M427DRAFT_136757 [Gonapodya prolifera JEL478]|eukprot:KXS13164.1 hypothetical protein M427DRAFT_136757 [Gonapodya prolifera JEL478]
MTHPPARSYSLQSGLSVQRSEHREVAPAHLANSPFAPERFDSEFERPSSLMQGTHRHPRGVLKKKASSGFLARLLSGGTASNSSGSTSTIQNQSPDVQSNSSGSLSTSTSAPSFRGHGSLHVRAGAGSLTPSDSRPFCGSTDTGHQDPWSPSDETLHGTIDTRQVPWRPSDEALHGTLETRNFPLSPSDEITFHGTIDTWQSQSSSAPETLQRPPSRPSGGTTETRPLPSSPSYETLQRPPSISTTVSYHTPTSDNFNQILTKLLKEIHRTRVRCNVCTTNS